ncbi:MAG TPA: sec-independent translocase [Jatrophihabitans sp.]|nr:sec-independent translocase [Jatrophihabitans sp.]
MFNIGPLEFVVLAAVALIVFGPDKLPQLAKDAARMLRTLRDIAQGARSQLNSELGPEFADFDLSSLNPRTAIKNALLGDDDPRPDLAGLDPRQALTRAWRGEDEPTGKPVSGPGPAAAGPTAAAGLNAAAADPQSATPPAAAPTPYDTDAT